MVGGYQGCGADIGQSMVYKDPISEIRTLQEAGAYISEDVVGKGSIGDEELN